MPIGDQTKEIAFELWRQGRPLEDIQERIRQQPDADTLPRSVKNWVRDWERGAQKTWTPTLLTTAASSGN